MTTFDPGASVVLTHGLRVRPFSTAFLASSAAPIMTDGFDVLVHEVIEAMATAPWSIVTSWPSSVKVDVVAGSEVYVGSADRNDSWASARTTRSCGRFGPAIDGTTVDRSSSRYSE